MIIKFVSPLEKCFLDESIESFVEYRSGSALKNERFHFSLLYTVDRSKMPKTQFDRKDVKINIVSELLPYITVFKVEHVPSKKPACADFTDDDYLRTAPGLYPDLMIPINSGECLTASKNLETLYFEVGLPEELNAGSYGIKVQFEGESNGQTVAEAVFTLKVINAVLPKQEIKYTNWFHYDCLALYYDVEVFSEEHWRIIENFLRTAVKLGVNMIYTPLLTPAIDTRVGGERLTVQLVDVYVNNGNYEFSFDKLKRFVSVCLKVGIKYFEICHLFTQWGAAHTPKVMATVDGDYKRIFGWETDADSEEYKAFLRALLPQFTEFMKSLGGLDRLCYFHISDEPTADCIEQYTRNKNTVREIIGDYPIIDALSDFKFYECGAVEHPVPATDHIKPFIEAKIKDLWAYYCIGQWNVSNRFFGMPLSRTRIIGVQLYKYGISGFLHWGYNYYCNFLSRRLLNPYLYTDGDQFGPSGDEFVVYPAKGGSALESTRAETFFDALQDISALKLCESIYGKDFVIKMLEEDIKKPISFSTYPKNRDYLIRLREKVNSAIEKSLNN